MGLFSSVKFGDVISGAAKSLDDRLKDDMRRTQERSERVREYHITRKRAKEERFETEQRDLKDVLNNLASLVQDSDIPQGMTKYDYAAQLYNAGGGTITGGQTMFANLTSEKMKGNTNIKTLMGLADTETGGKGISEYIDRFANRPSELTKLPKELTGGVGLMGKLFDVDTSAGLSEEMKSMFPERAAQPTFDVPTAAVDYSGMSGAVEYKQGQLMSDAQLEQLNLANKKLRKEIGDIGTLEISMIKENFNRELAAGLGRANIAVDTAGNFNVKSGTQQFEDARKAHENTLQGVTKQVVDTSSLGRTGMTSQLVSYARQALSYYPNNKPPQGGDNMQIGKMYRVKVDGDTRDILWTGDSNNLIYID